MWRLCWPPSAPRPGRPASSRPWPCSPAEPPESHSRSARRTSSHPPMMSGSLPRDSPEFLTPTDDFCPSAPDETGLPHCESGCGVFGPRVVPAWQCRCWWLRLTLFLTDPPWWCPSCDVSSWSPTPAWPTIVGLIRSLADPCLGVVPHHSLAVVVTHPRPVPTIQVLLQEGKHHVIHIGRQGRVRRRGGHPP